MNFDYDLFVIGGGSGGVRAARVAADHGAKVAIAEEHRYGGTCVIRGCVPKKLFVYASQFGDLVEDAAGYGWELNGTFNWTTLRKRKDAEIDRLNSIYIGLLKDREITMFDGHARLLDDHRIEVNGSTYSAKTILLATGGAPKVPDIPGSELAITSNEAFYLDDFPKHIAIVGAGYIGLEFAGIFHGLGAAVTLVHHRNEVLRGFDEDIRHEVTHNLRTQGVNLLFDTEVRNIQRAGDGLQFTCQNNKHVQADALMFSTGRRPNTTDLGLSNAGVVLGERGEIVVDDYSKTNVDHIYAVGDCTDRVALTPVAIREGQAFADTVFGNTSKTVELPNVPTAIFCQPEVGTVGQTETEAQQCGEVTVYKSKFRPLFHTLSGRNEKTMIKMIVDNASDKVVGLHMVGHDAAEIIQAAAIAMAMGATKADFDRTLALHPSTAEELVLMRTPAT